MATQKEVEKQLREAKKEVRELRTHNQFLLDRLEVAHARTSEWIKKFYGKTIDDCVIQQKNEAEYQDKLKKDKELIETFDKQSQLKLNSNLNGITNG